MGPASAIDFARSSILVLLEIIAPSMLTALVVGLGIGLLQAVRATSPRDTAPRAAARRRMLMW